MTKLKATILAGVAVAAAASTASAEKFIVAHDLPPQHYMAVRAFEGLMTCVKDGTAGAIEFDYFPGGTVLKRDQGITGIQDGLAQITFVTIGEETARMPMQGVTMLPGFATSATELATAWRKAYSQDGLFTGEWKAMGVRPLSLTALAPYQIASNKSALIDGPDSFEGKKIRSTGSALNFLIDALGGVAVQLPGPEIYTAMQRGTVDATLISYSGIKPYSIQEVMSGMSVNGAFGTATQAIGMSEEAYAKLTPERQKVFDDCGHKIEVDLTKWIDDGEATVAAELKGMGIEIFEFSAEDVAAFDAGMVSVKDDFVGRLTARGIPADKAYDELMAALGR